MSRKICEHKKVYKEIVLSSYAPQFLWTCSVCGTRGLDRELSQTGLTYEQLNEQIKKANDENS